MHSFHPLFFSLIINYVMWPVPVGEGIASDLWTGRQAGRLHYIEYLPVVVDASCIVGATKLHMHILSFSLHDMNEYTTIQYKNKALRGRCAAYSFFFRAPKCISCKSNVIDVCKLKVPHCMQLHGPPSYSCFLYMIRSPSLSTLAFWRI